MININSVRATTTGVVQFMSEAGNIMVVHTMSPEDADRLATDLQARARDARLIDTAIREAKLIMQLPLPGLMREEFAMKAEPETPVEKEVEKPKRKPRQAKASPLTPAKAVQRRMTSAALPRKPAAARGSLSRSTLTPSTRRRAPRATPESAAVPVTRSSSEVRPGTGSGDAPVTVG